MAVSRPLEAPIRDISMPHNIRNTPDRKLSRSQLTEERVRARECFSCAHAFLRELRVVASLRPYLVAPETRTKRQRSLCAP